MQCLITDSIREVTFMPPVECNDWVKKEYIDKAPVWCSVEFKRW